jgi:arylsulfatase A-like enzyme
MPELRSDLADHGVKFTNSFVVNSLCCPSRVSSLTGRYSHSTGVYSNSGPYGGFGAFDDSSTVATWLHDAGYRTALMGKYLNGYQNTAYIPPGWDRWFAFEGETFPFYYDYRVNDQGTIKSFGSAPAAYSTDVLASRAARFIRRTDRPFFLVVTPTAPHTPAVPGPGDEEAFSHLKPYRPLNYNEEDVSDKPSWIANRDPLDETRQFAVDRARANQFRSLLGVDRAVGRIVDALQETQRLSSTMIAFTSDNGLSRGEHRWTNKQTAYEPDIRVPLVIRYDPLTAAPRRDAHLALNIDLAATWADLAGVAAPQMDGVSLVPLLRSPSPPWRSDFLIEHLKVGFGPPTYCAIRSEQFTYVVYGTGEQELYDLSQDRYELTNVANDPSQSAVVMAMEARLRELCDPPPPGYVVSSADG